MSPLICITAIIIYSYQVFYLCGVNGSKAMMVIIAIINNITFNKSYPNQSAIDQCIAHH